MYKAVGGSYITDHQKEMNAANTATLRSGCTLPSGKRVNLILYGAGPGQSDIAIDVSFSCIEAHEGNYQSRIEQVEKDKEAGYLEECKELKLLFYPFVLGAHGGFGEKAKELWKILVGHAKKVQGRDWRHSWTAMSYSKVWEQKLSIALANAEAVGHQQRAPAVTRRLALGGRMDESGEGLYESSGDGGVDDRA